MTLCCHRLDLYSDQAGLESSQICRIPLACGDYRMSHGLVGMMRRWLGEPELRGVDPDSDDFTRRHAAILARKPFARQVLTGFCRRCRIADERYFSTCSATLRLEMGSGAGLMKQVVPDVITSEVKHVSNIDLIARAEDLPFADQSLRAIYAINTFHHVSDPRAFFREAARTLAAGGGIVLIEPYYGPFARLLFKRLFTMESYDTTVPHWPRHERTQVASAANQALSYIVLQRDRALWQGTFPELEILLDEPHTHLSYLTSGGANFRQILPNAMASAIVRLEQSFPYLNPFLALQHTVVIRRR